MAPATSSWFGLAVFVVGLAITAAIYYPGIMTADTWYVYGDIPAESAGDWQSPVMTWIWGRLQTFLPGSPPGPMFLLIATIYWAAFGVLTNAVARRSPRMAILVPIVALSPPAFLLVGVIWRDVLMAACWLLAAALGLSAAGSRRYRMVFQGLGLALIALGLLMRPNALFGAPVLAAYVIWPSAFSLKRWALLYVPGVVVFYAVIQIAFYGLLHARVQHLTHSILVFDLGGISAFSGTNQFPGKWSEAESTFIVDGCYQPAYWDTYWWKDPCSWVMDKLDGDQPDQKKLFGTPELFDAWKKAVIAHPVAYLQHRLSHFKTFLTYELQQTVEYTTIDQPDKPGPRNAVIQSLRRLHDAWQRSIVFLPGLWLALALALLALAWGRRSTPGGTYALGVGLSAIFYLGTFLFFGVASAYRYAYWPVLADLTGFVAVLASYRLRQAVPGVRPTTRLSQA